MQRKLLGILCAFSMLFIGMPVADATPGISERKAEFIELNEVAANDQEATFQRVWLEHNVRINEQKGMRIHARFTVRNNSNVRCRMLAQFYRQDGTPLPSATQGSYRTSENQVYTFENFTPNQAVTEYADMSLFIPYSAFNIRLSGLYRLKFIVFLERIAPVQVFATSASIKFTYTKS